VEGNKKAIALPMRLDANYTLLGLGSFLRLNSTAASTCMPLLLIVAVLPSYRATRCTELKLVVLGLGLRCKAAMLGPRGRNDQYRP
jgi:hypothetical protein